MESMEFVAARNALGLSQSAIATALGVDQATISRWESGKVRIPNAIELALAALQENTPAMTSERRRILVSDPIAPEGIEMLRAVGEVDVKTGISQEELIATIPPYHALVVRSESKVTPAVLEAAKNLEVVGRAGVGVDNIDLPTATERGVVVVNAPQGNTIAAAEHTIALLFALARHVPAADASMRAGKWARKDFIGVELRGKTMGVIGLGPIGSEVARRAAGLDMRVLAVDPFVPEERARALGAEPADLEQAIAESDFITVHVPMTPQTKGMIGGEQFAAMKDGVRILNVARGGIVDEQALADAVKSGKVAGAAVDVFSQEPVNPDNPLLGDPRIITTPHLGASTAEAQERVALDVAEQIVEIFQGKPARYAVNAPMLAPEAMLVVGPFMEAAETLGLVATQMLRGRLTSIEIDYYGEIADHDVQPLRAAIIRGLMRPISDENVNLVNANHIAQSRGWRIEERLQSTHDVFTNLIHLRVGATEGEISIGGGVHQNGQPNIVSINDLDIDLVPAKGSSLVVCDNDDRPGMIGRIGTLLGTWDINISAMQVGRREKRGRALMLLAVDEAPTDEQVAEIDAIDGIYNTRVVRF